MLNHKTDEKYEYLGHHWLNEQLACGCVVAICLDVELADNDRKFLMSNFTKLSTLKNLSKEFIASSELNQLVEEQVEIQKLLSQYIDNKRKEHNFPNGIDCNSDYYSLKLQQGISCKI
jgi:hypothetical protein